MFETFGFQSLTAPQAAVFAALAIGLVFGILAERTAFCFRRALVGADRRQARGIWFMALAVAVIGTQAAVARGWIGFADHRFLANDLPWLAIVLGGLAFGAGMVLTRGCISRLTVLGAGGNLRALSVLIVVAIAAHATLKGVLSPMRVALEGVTLPLGDAATLAALPGGALVWSAVIAFAALAIALRSGNRWSLLGLAALLGALVPLAWVTTGFVLYDDFDPIAKQALSFTAPFADSLFFTIASSAISANFGVGLIGGTFVGAFIAALVFRSFAWQSFSAPRETGRYALGAVLMGSGGVLAGGCTIGAGLSGLPTLSVAALLALVMIAAGALATHRFVSETASGSTAPSARRQAQPAE